jgi:hypothetical protein
LQAFDATGKFAAGSLATWKGTVDWLCTITKSPFVGKFIPTKPRRAPLSMKDALWNVGQTMDALNAELADQQQLIIRGERGIAVVWSDEPIDPSLVPSVTLAGLKERGKSEMVSLTVMLNGKKASEMVPVVKKMLSRLGQVHEEICNQMTIRDRAENVRDALAVLQNSPTKKQ